MRMQPYSVLYVDQSRIKRQRMEKVAGLAGRDVRFTCCDASRALARLKRDDEKLDALVVYAFGWGSREADVSRCVDAARENGLPVIYVAGNTTVLGLDLKKERHRECITYTDSLDLIAKVKGILDEKAGEGLGS